jgi:hypothetical protein
VDAKGNVVRTITTVVNKDTRDVTVTVAGMDREESLILHQEAAAESKMGPEFAQVLVQAQNDLHAAGFRDDEVAYGCGFWNGLAAVSTCVLAGAACAGAGGITAASGGTTLGGAIIVCGVGATYCYSSIMGCA